MAGRPAWLRAEFWRIAEPPLSPAATGAAALGAVVLVVGCVLTSGSAPDGSAAASAPAGADAATVALTTWYSSTQGMRSSIATSVQNVRAALDAQDGSSLQPRCVQLAAGAKAAARLPAGPDPQAQQMFAGGVEDYATAAASCRQLFDGTQIPVPELQSRVRAALADGDREWQSLATLVGLPVAVPLSSGAPVTGGSAPAPAPGSAS